MSARDQLNSYIRLAKRRLQVGAAVRGTAVLVSVALLTTLALVLIANAFAFSSWSVISARVVLICALAGAAVAALVFPLMRLSHRHAAGKAEGAFPQFQERLITFVERDPNAREPFVDLLAADTLEVARRFDPESLVSNRSLVTSLGVALAALGILIWTIAAGPGFMGYGASLLWLGSRAGTPAFYAIQVTPGNASVRRNSDELVTAQPIGFQASRVRLFARYDSTTKWNELAMKPQPGGSGFEFVFAGLPEGVEYYAESGAVKSPHFHIGVVDLPNVKQIQVTYHYPAWTGKKDSVDAHGGDLRAIQGTTAHLAIHTDRPLSNGVLVLADGKQIPLTGGQKNVYQASVAMTKDGAYHVAANYQGKLVRLSEDYFIAANKANPPDIQLARPGGDYRASPIEEVTVDVKAADDFGLKSFDLHYSVNGGADQTVNLLKQSGAKQADGSTVISLEKFKLVPGDVVSYYATAKDGHGQSHTGINFIEARPFEIDYSQSQQAGGGGGGGGRGMNSQSQISQREREIIASTWNQQNMEKPSAQQAAETAKFLSGVQAALRKQATALAGRMQLRQLNGQNQSFSDFQKDMAAAADAMGPAVDKLSRQQWKQAMPNEQKALQHLLRAEATFRKIQVAFGGGGGGGGGGANAGRDLAGLFDLELDTQKNQYETAQTASSSNSRSQKIDDALRKLDELARRQQNLANQRSANGQSFQQRWQEEMLHRQAQQLQRQLEQMARNQQGQMGQQGQQGSASSSSGQSGQGGSAQSGSANSGMQRALQALRQANQALERASSQQRNSADARRAADALRQATNALNSIQNQQAGGQIDAMAREAQRLAGQQKDQTDRLRNLTKSGQSADLASKVQSLARDRQQLANNLGGLEQRIRGAASQLAPTQPNAASKLRDALGNLDKSDAKMLLQRGADWLRQGYAPNPGTDAQIGSALQKLSDNLRQAQGALGPAQAQNSQMANALNRTQQLRNQVQALQRAMNGRSQGGQQGQGRSGQQGQGQQAQMGQLGRAGQPGQRGAGPGGGGGISGPNGPVGTRIYQGYNGIRQRGGYPNWNIDTGGQRYSPGHVIPPNNSPIPGDPEATFQQYVDTLNELQRSVQQDPDLAREVQNLIRQMQNLDPRRFPGNPQVFNQMAGRALAGVDKIELQLRSKLNQQTPGQDRAGASMPVPQGYQDAVADYFRRLSDTNKNIH